jgi:AAA+ ATPase superfamily predicted ATPase
MLQAPLVAEKARKFQPSDNWLQQLTTLKKQLSLSQQQTNIQLKKEQHEQFLQRLAEFRSQTLLESNLWKHYYLEAIDRWLQVGHEELRDLQIKVRRLQPMSPNIYRAGEALQAGLDRDIFVGREDLKETLSTAILTARTLPMFLIQGQRRVGKTSLLNFLPELLGPKFEIVQQDAQNEKTFGVLNWLADLRQKTDEALGLPAGNWTPPSDWLQAWGELRAHLETVSRERDCKLILAIDEYENLHRNFSENPRQAENLLSALRSFSQHQNQVVFLFVGAHFFSELKTPNWNEYFVQVKLLRVDYLKPADTLKLIQKPVPDFNLIYPDELARRIFELTLGHPTLVQQICSEMVNRANQQLKNQMTAHDLEEVLKNHILQRENMPIQIFWSQFCSDTDKNTVLELLNRQPVTDKKSLSRLAEHGFIVEENGWKIRVPLFETWLRKYAETF